MNKSSKDEPESFVSIFPQFALNEDLEGRRQAGGMLSQSDGLIASGRLGI